MIIRGTIPMRFCPIVPTNLENQISINTIVDIERREGVQLYLAMRAISQLMLQGVTAQGFANVYFVDTDELCLVQNDTLNGGCFLPLVIFPLHRWRALRMTDLQMLTVMLEELCHSLFLIRDELAVKHMVTKAVQQLYPNLTIQKLYPGL